MKTTGSCHRAINIVAGYALFLEACRGAPTPAREAVPGSTAAASAAGGATSSQANGRATSDEISGTNTSSFDHDPVGTAPRRFSFALTGRGAVGRWTVIAEPGGASGSNVLAQLDADATNYRFPIAVAHEPVLKDVSVSVRCKMVAGRVDQACGLVARYRDENNYFITRANALEGNIRLYTVKNGERDEIASHDMVVTANIWHEYRLDVRGDHLEVFWNAQRVLDHHDGTFMEAGRAGVWTKADSVTYFDDFKVQPLQ